MLNCQVPIFNWRLFFCLVWKLIFHHPHFELKDTLATFRDNCIMHNFSGVWNIFHSGIAQVPNDVEKRRNQCFRELCKSKTNILTIGVSYLKTCFQFSNMSYTHQHFQPHTYSSGLIICTCVKKILWSFRLGYIFFNNCANNSLSESSHSLLDWIKK